MVAFLGRVQLACVRVPDVLTGDDEREGRRECSAWEGELAWSEAGGSVFWISNCVHSSCVRVAATTHSVMCSSLIWAQTIGI